MKPGDLENTSRRQEWVATVQNNVDSMVSALKGFEHRPLSMKDAEHLLTGIRSDSEQILRRLLPLLRNDSASDIRFRSFKR